MAHYPLSSPVMSDTIILNIKDIYYYFLEAKHSLRTAKQLDYSNTTKRDMDTLKAQAPVRPWHDHSSHRKKKMISTVMR